MKKNLNREETELDFRKQIVTASVKGIFAGDGRDYAEITRDAFALADSIIAGLELPSRVEHYRRKLWKETEKREKERADRELSSKVFEPLHEWAGKNQDKVLISPIFRFIGEYDYKNHTGDIVENFENWARKQYDNWDKFYEGFKKFTAEKDKEMKEKQERFEKARQEARMEVCHEIAG